MRVPVVGGKKISENFHCQPGICNEPIRGENTKILLALIVSLSRTAMTDFWATAFNQGDFVFQL